MKLVATSKLSEDTVSISNVSQIIDNDGIYCISGLQDIRSLSKEPVIIGINGIDTFKAYNIELDIRQYRTIKIFP